MIFLSVDMFFKKLGWSHVAGQFNVNGIKRPNPARLLPIGQYPVRDNPSHIYIYIYNKFHKKIKLIEIYINRP